MRQGGDTPLQPVLRAATAVKILTKNLIYYAIVGFIAQISLDLDQLDRIYYQRYNGLTVDYGEYFKLTYFDRGRSSVVECHPCVGKGGDLQFRKIMEKSNPHLLASL